MEDNNFFPITIPAGNEDLDLFLRVVNQGIDARLEAFTESQFTREGGRVCLNFADNEMKTLLRRLLEIADKEADNNPDLSERAEHWADDILWIRYGVEII